MNRYMNLLVPLGALLLSINVSHARFDTNSEKFMNDGFLIKIQTDKLLEKNKIEAYRINYDAPHSTIKEGDEGFIIGIHNGGNPTGTLDAQYTYYYDNGNTAIINFKFKKNTAQCTANEHTIAYRGDVADKDKLEYTWKKQSSGSEPGCTGTITIKKKL